VTTLALALIVVGLILTVVEAHTPTYGVLAVIGLGLAVTGVVLLTTSGVSTGVWVIGLAGLLVTAAVVFIAVYKVALAQRWRPKTGVEEMPGRTAVALEDLAPARAGWVRFDGARWRARATAAVRSGEEVEIESVAGLELRVRPTTRATRTT
jgi:membrane-bound ClpP family serine protease